MRRYSARRGHPPVPAERLYDHGFRYELVRGRPVRESLPGPRHSMDPERAAVAVRDARGVRVLRADQRLVGEGRRGVRARAGRAVRPVKRILQR